MTQRARPLLLASAALMLGLLSMATHAAAAGLACANDAERTASVTRLVQMLDALRARIERPSPSEADFLRRESAEALAQGNRGRFRIVFNNPMYRPLQVHDDIEKVIKSLRRAELGNLREKTGAVIDTLGSYPTVVASLSAYIDFDSQRSNRVLKGDDVEALSFDKQAFPSVLARYGQCLLDLIAAR